MTNLTVSQLCELREDERRTYCRKPPSRLHPEGRLIATVNNVRYAHGWLRETPDPEPPAESGLLWREDGRTLGETPAKEFTAKKLHAVKQRMIAATTPDGKAKRLGLRTINDVLDEIKRTFSWAAEPEQELVPEELPGRLELVKRLKLNRAPVRMPETIKPLAEMELMHVLIALDAEGTRRSRMLATMLQLQWITGMRPGEVVMMCRSTIDQTTEPWQYIPEEHKTQHFNKDRLIYIGGEARKVLAPWLAECTGEWLFPGKTVNEHIKRLSYYRAVQRLCDDQKLPRFGLNRLRHAAATRMARLTSADDAKLLLDHSSVGTTKKHYIEKDEARKRELAERFG